MLPLNLVLRIFWIFSISPQSFGFTVHPEFFITFLTFSEITRRGEHVYQHFQTSECFYSPVEFGSVRTWTATQYWPFSCRSRKSLAIGSISWLSLSDCSCWLRLVRFVCVCHTQMKRKELSMCASTLKVYPYLCLLLRLHSVTSICHILHIASHFFFHRQTP